MSDQFTHRETQAQTHPPLVDIWPVKTVRDVKSEATEAHTKNADVEFRNSMRNGI